jgi:hypothetical protein
MNRKLFAFRKKEKPRSYAAWIRTQLRSRLLAVLIFRDRPANAILLPVDATLLGLG